MRNPFKAVRQANARLNMATDRKIAADTQLANSLKDKSNRKVAMMSFKAPKRSSNGLGVGM